VKAPSAPGNTCIFSSSGFCSAGNPNAHSGTMPPAFTSTGISPSGLNKVAMRPPSYRVPLKKSNHSPCGSQASAPASSVSGPPAG
jgi:hypothetical protein